MIEGLSFEAFQALRPQRTGPDLAALLCPPYDVIDASVRARLLAGDPDNIVRVILPEPSAEGYRSAAADLAGLVARDVYATDAAAALYVYDMTDQAGHVTRGLVGAVELRDPADGVILPHENTMAGPVADRLEVMTATDSDLEPIYLVYDGGGAASQLVRDADTAEPLARTTTADGITHTVWAITDPERWAAVAADLSTRRALIADGHHRYATYRERQRRRRQTDGAGPWDRGLALLVDSTDYGPQVHAIHRVVPGLDFDDAVAGAGAVGSITLTGPGPADALRQADAVDGFAAVVTDGARSALVLDTAGNLRQAAQRPDEPAALSGLDVTVVHRGLVEYAWKLPDNVESVGYAHSVAEAIGAARATGGVAVLLRPTPVAAVTAVAAAGARMPRKSTLFTPKPASGLLIRRLADQHPPA